MIKNWTNKEISQLLESVAAAYIIKNENPFKIKAYQEAASSVAKSSNEIKDLWEENKLNSLPGIGKNIGNYLEELIKTGKVKHFAEMKRGLPEALFEFLQIPGLGPKSAYKLAIKLKINNKENCLEKLKKAAESGKIKEIEGFGVKSETEILQGLTKLSKRDSRILLATAEEIAEQITEYLRKCPAVLEINQLGSLRRKLSTVGDIDLSVVSSKPQKVINWFLKYPKKIKVFEAGSQKATIIISPSYQIDLRIGKKESYGSLLQHFTGSKQHNIHLREIAMKKGWSLSEYGIKKLKTPAYGSGYSTRLIQPCFKPDPSTFTKASADKSAGRQNSKLIKFKDEESLYNTLGMEWIPAELREDTGEIEIAQSRQLPHLVELKDIKGDLHLHSNFNIETSHDIGSNSMSEMVMKASALGYQYIAFSEHNPSLIKHTDEQIIKLLQKKKKTIDQLNYSRENNIIIRGQKVFIFNSLEIDIRPDGTRSVSDQALGVLDFGIASVHSSFNLSKGAMTKRILKGLDHPKVRLLGHPTGRMINKREGYEVDWPEIFRFCQENNKYIEINSYPERLDLPDFLIREAIRHQVKLVINTDSHDISQMDFLKFGVFQARRGWLEKSSILNTLSCDKIKKIFLTK